MTALPTGAYVTNTARTVAEIKQAMSDIIGVIAELLGGSAESTLTIATGAVTPTLGLHTIDTETQAATDDLTTINTTNVPDGRLLMIRCADNTRNVVVKHNAGGAGQIALADAADYTLDDTTQWLLLKRTGTNWQEVGRFYGNNKTAFRAYLGLVIGTDVQAYDVDTAKLDLNQTWAKAQRAATTALTDGATINLDFSLTNDFSVTLGGNRSFTATNMVAGQRGVIRIKQDATGGRTASWSTDFEFVEQTAFSLSTGANAEDVVPYYIAASGRVILGNPLKNVG